jgi:hypothetical protein
MYRLSHIAAAAALMSLPAGIVLAQTAPNTGTEPITAAPATAPPAAAAPAATTTPAAPAAAATETTTTEPANRRKRSLRSS